MTREEKAKAYDEAIKVAKGLFNSPRTCFDIDQLANIFPQLAESEDERIRRGIVETIKQCPDTFLNPKNRDDMLAYLEKQKEQKPVESISQLTVQGKGVYKICPRCKERMVRDDSMVYTSMPPQYRYECPKCGESECDTVMYDNPEMEEKKPAEWSEEDESELTAVIYCVSRAIKASKDENERNSLLSAKKWLQDKLSFRVKSLRPRLSDEEIKKIRSEEYTKGFNDAAFGGKIKEWSVEDEDRIRQIERIAQQAGCTQKLQEEIHDWLKSLRLQPVQLKEAYKEGFDTARHATALAFMNYCDKIRPNGKMCLSNGECEEIEKAFLVGDWEKIERYFNKCHWKPSEEQMKAMSYFVRKHQATANRATTKWPEFEAFKSLYNVLKKLM